MPLDYDFTLINGLDFSKRAYFNLAPIGAGKTMRIGIPDLIAGDLGSGTEGYMVLTADLGAPGKVLQPSGYAYLDVTITNPGSQPGGVGSVLYVDEAFNLSGTNDAAGALFSAGTGGPAGSIAFRPIAISDLPATNVGDADNKVLAVSARNVAIDGTLAAGQLGRIAVTNRACDGAAHSTQIANGVTGKFLITAYGETRATLGSSLSSGVVSWTGNSGARTRSIGSLTTAVGSVLNGTPQINVVSGNVTIDWTDPASGNYDLYVEITQL